MKTTTKFLMLALVAFFLNSCTKGKLIDEPGNLVPKTVAQDDGLPSISVDGALLHAEAFGHPDSTIIICLHGGPGGDYRGLLNAKDLADHGYRVVFYDQRGSGLSQRFPQKSYSNLGPAVWSLLHDELSGVIAYYKTHPQQKVYLMGHSWGAMLATSYVGKYPDRIQGLVVCEPGGLKWNDVMEFVKESRSFKLWGETLNDVTYLDQFITGKEDQHEILDYKLAMLASKNEITGEDNTQPGSSWRSGAAVNAALFEVGEEYEPDFSGGISGFNQPVLFIYSSQNKAYTDAWAQKISAAYNTVELSKVHGVGHDGIISNNTAWKQQTMPKMLEYFNSLQ